jgi:TonB family protein
MPKLLIITLAFLAPFMAFAGEISDIDIATYSLTGKDGQPIGMQMRLSRSNGKWVMEGKKKEPAAPWKNLSCDTGCEYRTSTNLEQEAYLKSFPGDMSSQFEIACIQNMASAFCRITKKNDATKGGYALIALVTGKPVPISLQRLTSPLTSNETVYGSYEPKRILTVTETSSGKTYGIDTKYLDQILNDLGGHAKNYPPHFDTDQDKLRAVQDIKMLSGMLDILINGPSPNLEILWRAGFLNSMGHNLDIAGSAEKASTIFKNLLAMFPSDPRGNYMYGTFLAGIGKPKDALPYLEKALSVGVTDAAYTLGMTHLSLGNKESALVNLEAYKQRNPNDINVNKLVDAIRNGKVEIKRNSNGAFDPLPFFESPKQIGGEIPQYPRAARMNSICGEVRVALSISMSGNVSSNKLIHSEPPGVFDSSVEKVVGTWIFERKFKGDTVIPYQTVIPFKFRIGPDDPDCRQPKPLVKDGR